MESKIYGEKQNISKYVIKWIIWGKKMQRSDIWLLFLWLLYCCLKQKFGANKYKMEADDIEAFGGIKLPEPW